MNEEIKEQWVTALCIGGYKQGRGELRTIKNEFCCLGVLCDLAVKAGVAQWVTDSLKGWWVIPNGQTLQNVSDFDRGGAALPRFIREWAGLELANPMVTDAFGNRKYLSTLNDTHEERFTVIADYIEKSL